MTIQLHPTDDPSWSPGEIGSVRAHLVGTVTRMRTELAGNPVQPETTAAMLVQVEHVLARLDAGLHGICEGCSAAITRSRLQTYPHATLCATCVA